MGAAQLQQSAASDEQVLGWRLEQLRRAGLDEGDAERVAERKDVDLHQALRLLQDGCPPELALAILL
jgi:hypothetical protein